MPNVEENQPGTRARRLVGAVWAWTSRGLLRRPALEQPWLRPRTKLGVLLRAGVHLAAIVVGLRVVRAFLAPMRGEAPPPLPVVAGEPTGLPLEIRRKIFAEMAAAEIADRERDKRLNTWKGHLWSQEDDRGWRERVLARAIAQRHRVSLTQVFLAFEEGIRAKWPSPEGQPLPATVPPLDLRPE